MLSLLLHFSVDVHCWPWSQTIEIWVLIWETFSVRGFDLHVFTWGRQPSCSWFTWCKHLSAKHNAITWWLGQVSCAGARTPGSLLMGGEVDHGNRSTERGRANSFQMWYKIKVRALLLGWAERGIRDFSASYLCIGWKSSGPGCWGKEKQHILTRCFIVMRKTAKKHFGSL